MGILGWFFSLRKVNNTFEIYIISEITHPNMLIPYLKLKNYMGLSQIYSRFRIYIKNTLNRKIKKFIPILICSYLKI